MAELLYRIGMRTSAHARLTLTAWLALLALAGVAYLAGGGQLATSFSIPGTATAQVTERLESEFPAAAGGSGTVVATTDSGEAFTPEQVGQLQELMAQTRDLEGVADVIDPFATAEQRQQQAAQLEQAMSQPDAITEELQLTMRLLAPAENLRTLSADGSAALMSVSFADPMLDVSPETKEHVIDTLGQEVDGVSVDFASEISSEVPELLGPGEMIGLVIAGIVLVVMLGTLIGAGLPIVNALIGVGIGALGALSLSGWVDMVSVTPVLGVMLGLAVGIDYSLFIVNRHRRQLKEGYSVRESIGLANGTSGNAVVFAGSTVVIALIALNLTGVPFLGLMGSVGAVCVAIAVLVATTLTPALLAMMGERVLSKRERSHIADAPVVAPPARPMRTVSAVATVLVGVAALAVVAIPGASMRLGLPDGSTEAEDSTQFQAYQTIAETFGEGANGTLLVVADLPAPTSELDVLESQVAVAEYVAAYEDVVAVAPIGVSESGDVAAFQVIPAEGPLEVSTEQLVYDLREAQDVPAGVALSVAGQASGNIDISDTLGDALPVYLAVVVGVSLLIMLLVFRSVLVPIIATGGFILSVFAAFGGVVAIYQWGWLSSVFGVHAPGPVLNFLPTVLVGVLFGLAMDYMLFVGTGMREAYMHGTPARAAVVEGLHAGRSVVTAAAIIMGSVFGGFMFADSAMIRPIGFGLAFGVLVDAFVVRMWIVPAVMHLLGEKAWWLPRWLDRLLPSVDVEGAALERRHPHRESVGEGNRP